VSQKYETNGFDNNVSFPISSLEPESKLQETVSQSFTTYLDTFMSKIFTNTDPNNTIDPYTAIGFDYEEKTYYWEPYKLPFTIDL